MPSIRKKIAAKLRGAARRLDPLVRDVHPIAPRECPICGYEGTFGAFGVSPRPDSECLSCKSGERQRLLKLVLDRLKPIPPGAELLHFAAEAMLTPFIKPPCSRYLRADIDPERGDIVINIEEMTFEDASFDIVIVSHVLEHVDDSKALAEIHRVLRPGGIAILMVPLVEGWDETYENANVTNRAERHQHFGYWEHLRMYGRDFRDRVRRNGFSLEEHGASGADSARYALMPGDRVFIARKPAADAPQTDSIHALQQDDLQPD
jgi:SAM-dependent methyltransferase